MRLNKVKIHGFGRLAGGSMDLGPRVIAIVGPNEAGKSTFLDALVYLSDRQSTLPTIRRSRTVSVEDSTTVATGYYVLDDEESQGFSVLDLEELPRALELSRRAGATTRYMTVTPTPVRSRAGVATLVSEFLLHWTPDIVPPVATDEVEATESESAARDQLAQAVVAVVDALGEAVESRTERESVPDMRAELETLRDQMASLALPAEIRSHLDRLIDWIDMRDPGQVVRERLNAMVPVALLFSDADRNLPSTFSLDDTTVNDVPAAVQNLADMAGLSIPDLWTDIQQGNRAGFGTKLRTANNLLKAKFEKAWRQSDLTVHLDLSGTTIHIDIHQGEEVVTPIDERSAGLRMYVALTAFLERRSLNVKPILLIDEAETHLHVDAQADLVSSFMRQHQVAKVIYTTHSPACLPSDLGTNVRAVIPSRDNLEQSTLENSFWRNSTGFTPLMIAMGAGAAAFSTARYVVLAEGSTEMLLLPSLIRAATGIEELPYQVAPGLSESAPDDYVGLDIEGAHVAFLVDGDQGGSSLAARLEGVGVPTKQVVHLGSLMLEHVLDPAVYAAEYRQLLSDWNPHLSVGDAPHLSEDVDNSWPKQLETWARSEGASHLPGKRDLASYLVERGNAKPSTIGQRTLVTLHEHLMGALAIPA